MSLHIVGGLCHDDVNTFALVGSEIEMSTIAKARNSDPSTSHDAAQSITSDKLSETQSAIMVILRETPMCDEKLVEQFHIWESLGRFPKASDQSIRSRRAELVRAGFVEYAGFDEMMTTGRYGRVWRVVR